MELFWQVEGVHSFDIYKINFLRLAGVIFLFGTVDIVTKAWKPLEESTLGNYG